MEKPHTMRGLSKVFTFSLILLALVVIILNLPILQNVKAFLSVTNEEDLGGEMTSSPTVSVESPAHSEDRGGLDVIYQGPGGTLFDKIFEWNPSNANSCHCWVGPAPIKTSSFQGTGASAVSCGVPNHLNLFYEGTDNHLWHWGNNPTSVKDLGEGVGTPPTAVCILHGNGFDIYYGGTDGHLWRTTWSLENGWVPIKQDLGNILLDQAPWSRPSVVQGSNGIDIYFAWAGSRLSTWNNRISSLPVCPLPI